MFKDLEMPQAKRGYIKWFSEEKGYGFIAPEEGDQDIFFHYSSLKMKGFKTIAKDQLVEFETEKTNRGEKATMVKLVLC